MDKPLMLSVMIELANQLRWIHQQRQAQQPIDLLAQQEIELLLKLFCMIAD